MRHNTTVKDQISDYSRKSTFASFLPGIAGIKGIPIWCYYVNRGQAVTSFGVSDKDHGIMEFSPAHNSYQMVKRTGFRTFVKIDGSFFEPFYTDNESENMTIYMNGFGISDKSAEFGITTNVDYTTLPGEEIGALLRVVTIKNDSDKTRSFEVLDGMPAMVPYGVEQFGLKMMTQTTKAWMQVEDVDSRVPYYRVRVSMEDSAVIQKVDSGNFGFAVSEGTYKLPVLADPRVVFEYDLSLNKPEGFIAKGFDELLKSEQNLSNEFPCCFFACKKDLAPGQELTIYEIIGQVRNKEVLSKFLNKKIDNAYFEEKFAEADRLTDELTDVVSTSTADPVFDAYTRVNYMDNVLRGGSPIDLAGHIFYVYSRKHGDLERDYNYFSMSPEYYSQGNGNFRDVNQNRRCDTFFSGSSKVGLRNIKMFYSLLQLDGYNPLKIEQLRYEVSEDELKGVALKQPFTPGELYAALLDKGCDDRFEDIMGKAVETGGAEFGEGYWSDHWSYNLDLIEDYLEVFPDREKELLFDTTVSAFDCKEEVLPRSERYVKTENGIRQYNFLRERDTKREGSFAVYKNGRSVEMSLMAKMVILSAVKFSSLDVCGMGIEMDGGKPGWYDALNGMPALLGSSMNDTYELLRMIRYEIDRTKEHRQNIEVPVETAEFIDKLVEAESSFTDEFDNWNKRNELRESYRAKVYGNLSGETKELSADYVAKALETFAARIDKGVDRALEIGKGISPSYFTFDVDKYEETREGIIPLSLKLVTVPDFLEGPVRYLKLDRSIEDKRELYGKVKNSDLFDRDLNMYKVNSSLLDSSFELGRCRAFTPGWLENESIWMHMEYKYLLELIRSGLYPEFFEDFGKMAVPFLDKNVYGRSTLENSSFIASSKNPDKSIRGKGFVARLSGSTIEFISMWKLMFFGKKPFSYKDGELTFEAAPAIPSYLIREEDGKFSASAMLLGKTEVIYEFDAKKDYYPGNYKVTEYVVTTDSGEEKVVSGSTITGELAKNIREGRVCKICVKIILV
ncbi:hypothetical protein D6855_01865 [Butyrivibrio sp. CB08]|nr:hypothetical protein D6855_01865 [Butyrivibrio sp. CB08]